MSGLEGLLAGRTLVKRYRIEEVIGRGGFAVVYRATDESLGRTVAVKVITAPAPDPETRAHNRERFQQEARAAASLSHPNVVTVHDFGTDPALDIDFLVMEFLHGEDLATYLSRYGRPSLDLALRILSDAAKGLAVGHRAGLVHRDVKPGNLFLAEPHGQDPFRVCVLDFGIARAAEADRTVTGLTQGGIALSPAYASPEQARGERSLTPATDVFSLGVVGYQLLTGEKPFTTQRSNDPAEWVPAQSVRQIEPSVPAEVHEVIRRAMSFAPEDRFPDAAAMERALEEAVQASAMAMTSPLPAAVVSPPVEAPEDATEWQPMPAAALPRPAPLPPRAASAERHRPAVAMWGLLLFLLVGAGAIGVWALNGDEQGDELNGAEIAVPQNQQVGVEDDVAAEETTVPPAEEQEQEDLESLPRVTGAEPEAEARAQPVAAPRTSTAPRAGAARPVAGDTPAAAPPAAADRRVPATAPTRQRPVPTAQQPSRTAQQPPPAAQQPRPAARDSALPDSTPVRLLGDPVRDPKRRPAPRDTARPRADTATAATRDTLQRFRYEP